MTLLHDNVHTLKANRLWAPIQLAISVGAWTAVISAMRTVTMFSLWLWEHLWEALNFASNVN